MEENAALKLASFFGKYPVRSYRKRELILRPDSSAGHIFFMKKGFARQYLVSAQGQEFTTILYKKGDCYPIFFVLGSYEVNNRYFEAITPVELYSAPKEKFMEFIRANPEIFFEVTKAMANRLNIAIERLEFLTFGHSLGKIASILLSLTKRFSERDGKDTVITVPLTHKDLGSMAGISRETTSTEMEKLRKKGIIDFKSHKILIKDMRKLKAESLFDESL